MNSQENQAQVSNGQSEAESLRQKVQKYKTYLAQILKQKENLSGTCEDQATYIADITEQLEQIRTQNESLQQQFDQLRSQQAQDAQVQPDSQKLSEQL